MRRFAWIVTLPLIAAVTVFAIDNRQPVELEIWPLPWGLPPVPLYLLTLGLVLLGFAIGVIVMWVSAGGQRRRLRALKRDLDDARIELHELRRRPATPTGTAVAVSQQRLPPAA